MVQSKPPNQKKPERYNSFLKYTSLGLQMVVTLGVAGWIGFLIDKKLAFQFPLFLLLFIVIALIGTLYMLIKSISKDD